MADKELKLNILAKAHDVSIVAHPKYMKTYNTLRKSFDWHGLKMDVLAYVKWCLTRERIKAKRVKYLGKLQPLNIPQMK